MNRLEVKNVPLHNYWDGKYLCHCAVPVIDGKTLGDHINEAFRVSETVKLNYDCNLLTQAFSYEIEEYCFRFMEWVINSRIDGVIPILVCDGDNDFTCTVITAKVRYDDFFVYWDEISLVNKYFDETDPRFGILYTESYLDKDWEKYSDIAFESPDSDAFKKWCSENYLEEMFRRLKNGYFPFLQNRENTTVICRPKWQFNRTAYEKMLDFFLHADSIDAYENSLPSL